MADYEGPRYRIEHSISDRAGCQQASCKRAGIKIPKGELRLGIDRWFEPEQEYRTQWRHWRCVTPFQLRTLVENWSVTQIPGFKKLDGEAKARVRKAYSAGQIMEGDGPGKEAERVAAEGSKKEGEKGKEAEEKEEEAEEQEEEEEEENGPEAIAFKIDIATRAAMCRSAECVEKKVKIPPGDMRLGVIYDDKKSTWMYKHWMCATKEDLEGVNMYKKDDELEGFDALSDAHKAVVMRSLRHKKPVGPVSQVTSALEALAVTE